MSDRELRDLERRAKGGDEESRQRLAYARGRAGLDVWLSADEVKQKLASLGVQVDDVRDDSADGSVVVIQTWSEIGGKGPLERLREVQGLLNHPPTAASFGLSSFGGVLRRDMNNYDLGFEMGAFRKVTAGHAGYHGRDPRQNPPGRDQELRALERRAYDSDEDFLRYSAARLRAGLGPVTVVADEVRHNDQAAFNVRVYLFQINPKAGWAVFYDEGAPRPAFVRNYPAAVKKWQMMGFRGGFDATTAQADALARRYAEERILGHPGQLTDGGKTNPPGRDDAINAAFREWQAGDDASLERLMAERARAGLSIHPTVPGVREMDEAARNAGWRTHGSAPGVWRGAMTVLQAQAAIEAELRRRGWAPDPQAQQFAGRGRTRARAHTVWISPDAQERITFARTNVVVEKGGRGRWTRNYLYHTGGVPLQTIAFARRLLDQKMSRTPTREEWKTPMQNPDDKLRKLERAALGGDREAQARYWEELRRAGLSPQESLARVIAAGVGPYAADRITFGGPEGSGGFQIVTVYHVPHVSQKAIAKFLHSVFGARTSQSYAADDERDAPDARFLNVVIPGLRSDHRAWIRSEPMQNPPDRDVLYSIASLAQHGRTSTTFAALAVTTGRSPAQVALAVRQLAQRGLVAVRGPLVLFDQRVISAAVGGPAVGRKANPGDQASQWAEWKAQKLSERTGKTWRPTETLGVFEHGSEGSPGWDLMALPPSQIPSALRKRYERDYEKLKASLLRKKNPGADAPKWKKSKSPDNEYGFAVHYGGRVYEVYYDKSAGASWYSASLSGSSGPGGTPIDWLGTNKEDVNEQIVSGRLASKLARFGKQANPGMAVLGWAGNPGPSGMTLAQARRRLKKLAKQGHGPMLDRLVQATRPRDRDKLKAEIAHAFRQKNPGSTKSVGKQHGTRWKTVSIETAISRYGIDKKPGFKEALAHYRKFHKADPHSVRICTRKSTGSSNNSLVVTDMGEVPETQYVVKAGKDSNKAGHHWVHKHREKGKGTNPSLVFDPVSGTMMIVGGTYKVTDWIRN